MTRRIYRSIPIPRAWKEQYLLPPVFRLSGKWFRTSGAYQGWVIARNGPLFDRLAATYCRRLIEGNDPGVESSPDNPDVSIIILSHENSDYTLACIQSIRENTLLASFEIIVLDNGSSKEHAERLRRYIGDTHLIRQKENIGFAKGCNFAAKDARGNVLMFLNNDTIVKPGWLTALVKVLHSCPVAGIIGAKLVYADGTLQEAGGSVMADGHEIQRGKADKPGNERYNRLQPVAYCSGAAMLVRREVFESVGGFDERYAPAYYEDIDLCFSARAMGWQTYYCPEATVIHREGGTSNGVWGHEGVRSLINRNRIQFLEKWGPALQSLGAAKEVSESVREN